MTSNPQSAPLAWDGISQKVGETDSLLSNTQTRPAAKWQRYLALMLLVTMTAITLALGAILWQLTTKVDQLSRLQVSTSTASETNPFPFVGADCSIPTDIEQCIVHAESGSPLLFEDYWVDNPAAATVVPASFHLGYGTQLPVLETAIRAVHARLGNAVTEGKQIVIGMSSTQLIGAAMYAFSNIPRATADVPMKIHAHVPYYNAYEYVPSWFNSHLFEWAGNATEFEANQPVMDIVTAPNNPDGAMRNKSIPGAFGFYDHAYYWPHFTPVTQPVQYGPQDIACFTLSKLTGHAGSRIGWAILEDDAVADLMRTHIWYASGYVQENQLRAAALLQYLLSTNGSVIDYAMGHMDQRWEQLHSIAALSSRLSFQELEPAQVDSWTGVRRSPSPAYAWLRCNEERDRDCYQAMADRGIVGRPGPAFGAGTEYNRLELLMQPAVFDSLAAKLRLFMTS